MNTNTTAAAVSSRSRLRRRIRFVAPAVSRPATKAPIAIASWSGSSPAEPPAVIMNATAIPGRTPWARLSAINAMPAEDDVAADDSAEHADQGGGEYAGADELGAGTGR